MISSKTPPSLDKPQIHTVGDFFASDKYTHLVKPDYQRPYEWTQKHVRTLLDDLLNFLSEKSLQYRLGCIILYVNGENLEIVDGQQRLVTLWLIRHVLKLNNRKQDEDAIGKFSLSDDISYSSIKNACLAITEWFSDHSAVEKEITQLLTPLDTAEKSEKKKAELVFLCVDNREEAFQLFDSQNSRGKPLKVHNYLKARHLGCMSREEQSHANAYGLFEGWLDAKDSDEIEVLFNRLFKICEWSHRRTRTHLTTDNMERFFYGFNERDFPYPYQKHYIFDTDYFEIGRQFKAGEEFFWFVKHFRLLSRQIKECCFYKTVQNKVELKGELTDVYSRLQGWSDDQLYRCLEIFYAVAISYSNRFGLESLKDNVGTLFAWALSLRFVFLRLQDETLDDFATGRWNKWGLLPLPVFERIEEAETPKSLLYDMRQTPLSVIAYNNKNTFAHAEIGKYKQLLKAIEEALLKNQHPEAKQNV